VGAFHSFYLASILFFSLGILRQGASYNMMKGEILSKKWYFRLIQAVFLASLVFLIYLGIWGVLYEDDMPFVGFFWAGILIIAYWLIKKFLSRNS
jgi:hypothetical protein